MHNTLATLSKFRIAAWQSPSPLLIGALASARAHTHTFMVREGWAGGMTQCGQHPRGPR